MREILYTPQYLSVDMKKAAHDDLMVNFINPYIIQLIKSLTTFNKEYIC